MNWDIGIRPKSTFKWRIVKNFCRKDWWFDLYKDSHKVAPYRDKYESCIGGRFFEFGWTIACPLFYWAVDWSCSVTRYGPGYKWY